MSKTSRLALVAAVCLLTGAAMAQTAGPTAGVNATGMDGKALNGADLGTPGTGQDGRPPAMGAGTGTASDATKPANAPAGTQPAPGTGTKAAP